MKDSRKVIQPRYNGQIAVDEKEQVIVATDVSQNATDHAEFRLPRRYSNLIEEAMQENREDQLTLVGVVVSNQSQK